ncbi:MAG TPA: molecular chaperone DnaJ [Elusimicrobia bacterium]|nr:molecular chaperone DnaJ [Elusimicrobiota bacterium]HBT60585.1 molecular chaperone DnaJ [Elusimicrobiota bacterium]
MTIEFKDYYAALGVKKDASADDIKQAYRRLAKQHHPDLHLEKDKARASDKFKEINEAYEVLSDSAKKAKYDRIGPDWDARREPATHPGAGEASYEFRQGGQGDSFAGFSDFFETLFGEAGARGFGGGEAFQGASSKGQDEEAELPLALEDSLQGGDKKISILAPILCPVCRGSGRQGNRFCPACAGVGEAKREKSITVHLPKNIRDGMRLRLRGQGGPASRGAPAGDLFLRIRLLPHPAFKVSGSDLEATVTVMPGQASLGGEIAVPTLEGAIRIRIPAGTHSGRRLRIAGQGLGKDDGARGDLYAVVRIDIPGRIDERMERLYRELREAGS